MTAHNKKSELVSPQNPYRSFMVQASAGSGKTYQLCRRFLFLVAAGARPSQILTITFTVKAANEMRQRIIEEATRLLLQADAQREFDAALAVFYKEAAARASSDLGWHLPRPATAEETGKRVLAATQALRIATIDAVFKDWVAKFPWEASRGSKEGGGIAASFGIMETWEAEELHTRAWLELFKEADTRALLQEVCRDLAELEPGRGVLGLEQRIFELFRHHTFLWQCEAETGQAAFKKHLLASVNVEQAASWEDVLAGIEADLLCLAQATRRCELLSVAIVARDLQALQRERLLTRSLEVSKATLRGKKRDELAEPIWRVEAALREFDATLKASHLNRLGEGLYKLYQAWLQLRSQQKAQRGKLEFSDLAMGCYHLFHGEEGRGATWLIQKSVRHLLMDEFQDTSLLQWSIFRKLGNELLAGAGENDRDGIVPTVFIVGDGKQSIYGFREADPVVLDLARAQLNEYEQHEVQLNHSYRSSATILNFVNTLFTTSFDAAFPLHAPAQGGDGKPVVPDFGRVFLHEQFEDDSAPDGCKGVEAEASFVAAFLAHMLAHPDDYPVYEKKAGGGLRPLRPDDCCLLYRSSKHVELFERELRRAGVPYRREEQRSFFARPEIKDVLTFLQCLVFPADTVTLLSVLRSPLVGLQDAELLAGLQELNLQADSLQSEELRRYMMASHPRFGQLMTELTSGLGDMLPHEVLGSLLMKTQALMIYPLVFVGDEGHIASKNLLRLLELMIELEDEGYTSLPQCVKQLMVMQERDEWGSAAAQRNVVTLMTIHKAKGLEFPLVTVIGTGEEWYKLDRYWLKGEQGVAYLGRSEQQPHSSAIFAAQLARCRRSLYEESIRLLYVALTRASQYLVITAYRPKSRVEHSFYGELAGALKSAAHSRHNYFPNLLVLGEPARATRSQRGEDVKNPPSSEPTYMAVAPDPNLPAQIDLIAPHTDPLSRGLTGSPRQPGEAPNAANGYAGLPGLARVVGVFIHAALEHTAARKAWSADEAWQRLVMRSAVARRLALGAGHWQTIKQEVMLEVTQNVQSRRWQELLAGAELIVTEMPICHLREQMLVRGVIDLYLAKNDGLLVVDYKSAALLAGDWQGGRGSDFQQMVQRRCQQNGIERQLLFYCEAVKAMQPQVPVSGVVWLTKQQEAVQLFSL